MQIVINIPKDRYKRIIEHTEGTYDQISLLTIIEKGTPLPEGHGRLIDADKTISKICGSSCGCHLEECGRDNPCYSVVRISSASTIIEADKESNEVNN